MSCATASIDGHHVAIVRDGELSLYTVDPLVEIARAAIEPDLERAIAFVGRQVVVHDATRLRVFSMPRLALIAEVAFDRPARLLATSHHYALLARDDETLIANCTSESTTVAPTRVAAIVERATGLEAARFLTWPKRGPAEIWDAASRLPAARVAFELPPDACAVGTAGNHRFVWVATSGGDLITSRLSDGKTTVAVLPHAPERIVSHPISAWLVMDFDGAPHAVNSVLRSSHPLAIPRDRPRTLVPSGGSHAFVIVDEGERIARYEVGVDLAGTNVVAILVGGPLPDSDEMVPLAAAPPAPVQRVASLQVEVEPGARSLSSRFERRLDPQRETPADREPGRMRPIAPLVRPTPATPPAKAWREALFEWAKLVETTPTAPLPAIDSPLSMIAERASLDVPARRILHLLYADWLMGHGDAGVAASRLVEVAGLSAWEEALGNGQLGRFQLVTSHVGRCLLARSVGTFLDGRDPERGKRIDGNRTRDVAPGVYRVVRRADEAADTCALQLATKLGTLVLAGGDVDVDVARLEAWVRNWPLVVTAPPVPFDARAHELVVYIVDANDVALPDLP